MVDRATAEGSADAPGVGRRRFLTYLVAAPTLTVATRLAFEGEAAAADPVVPGLPQVSNVVDFGDVVTNTSAVTAGMMKLEVTPQNKVRFELPRTEVGQGITTAVSMIIADEMGVQLSDVSVQYAPSRPEFVWNQFTGSSTSMRSLWKPLRSIAAGARARLITAAAQRWGLAANTLTTGDSSVYAPDGRSATFGSLTADASKVTAPAVSSEPKPASQYKLIGKPTGRTDARDIVTGKAKYTMDTKVPGALPTIVVRPPTIGGTVSSMDDSAVRNMPGVVSVAKIPTGVAISATSFYEAMKAKDSLKVSWGAGPVDGLSDSDIRSKLQDKTRGFLAPKSGKTVDASFDFGFVSHAPMEVINAVANVKGGKAEVWCPAQTPLVAQKEIAKQLNMPLSSVTVHVTRAGGSFGRWLFFDAALEAAQISKAIGRPVKLMWTRNDDMRHGRMRPACHHNIRATYSGNQVLSFEHRMASVEVDLRHGLGEMLTAAGTEVLHRGVGQMFFNLSESIPYNFGATNMSLTEIDLGIPTGSWRSVHSASFRACEEMVIDQLAKQMGKDPVEFRLQFIKTQAGKNVVRKAADAGKWGRAMPKGWAQGIAYHEEHKSHAACLVEINATDPKHPRVTKAVMAIDVGRPINPRGLQAQMSGGIMDAISTVLQAGLHIDKGAVREGSYSDFQWAKQKNSPLDIEVHIMPATGEPGGAGELGVPTAAGAISNAFARATGNMPERFPINF